MRRFFCLGLILAGCGLVEDDPLQFPLSAHEKGTYRPDVVLGYRLFFDPRLSVNDRISCASCHQPKKGFSDGRPLAIGLGGTLGRHTPTVYAAVHQRHFFWDGRAASLEEQALGPITHPMEMGSDLDQLIPELMGVPRYARLFREAYGGEATPERLGQAIAAFEKALTVGPSLYDRYLNGEDTLSSAQIHGMMVFSHADCQRCHGGPGMSDGLFHRLGVGMDQPQPDWGRFLVTQDPRDKGAFKTPTLRNVAMSAPYMHDGSLKSLPEVVDFYDRGGDPRFDPELRPLNLDDRAKADLVLFLQALTGTDNLRDLTEEVRRAP